MGRIRVWIAEEVSQRDDWPGIATPSVNQTPLVRQVSDVLVQEGLREELHEQRSLR